MRRPGLCDVLSLTLGAYRTYNKIETDLLDLSAILDAEHVNVLL